MIKLLIMDFISSLCDYDEVPNIFSGKKNQHFFYL